jgi:uncharacterized protein YbdZ (MbtH family)
MKSTGLRVCCLDQDHPQWQVGLWPKSDVDPRGSRTSSEPSTRSACLQMLRVLFGKPRTTKRAMRHAPATHSVDQSRAEARNVNGRHQDEDFSVIRCRSSRVRYAESGATSTVQPQQQAECTTVGSSTVCTDAQGRQTHCVKVGWSTVCSVSSLPPSLVGLLDQRGMAKDSQIRASGVAPFQWTVERLGHKRLSTGCALGASLATERAGLWVTACSPCIE